MKAHQITFREIHKSDYNTLSKLISDTWNFEKYCSPKVARKMSMLYLFSCLTNQTFTCVAENNGEAVGIIMGKDEEKHRKPLKYVFRELFSLISVIFSKEGRKVLKFFHEFDKIDKALLEKCGMFFEGELAFFAVRSDQQGTGIGKNLYNRFLDYMNSQDIESFFLFTDSSCNYGFYEHQGIDRLEATKFSLRPYSEEDMMFYLYGTNNRLDS